MQFTNDELKEMLRLHLMWLNGEEGGKRINLFEANLTGANLYRANLEGANLTGANLYRANLEGARLEGANLTGANLYRANLYRANLEGANLTGANLYRANLEGARLEGANLTGANLYRANLKGANLTGAKNLIKPIGVEVGNYYWKRINKDFESNGYYFTVGVNNLRDGETFADDERVLCSYPGFHFASRSWCAREYGNRLYEVKIQIPKGAQINEPWATDGKASASKIKIVKVINSQTGEDVTKNFYKKLKED